MYLCRDSLWNSSISWDTHNPNLTDCMQSTLYSSVCAAYACGFPLWLYSTVRSRSRGRLQQSPRKGVFGTILVSSRIIFYFLCLTLSSVIPLLQRGIYVSDVVSCTAINVASLLSVISELIMLRCLKHTSGTNTVLWFLLLAALLPGLKISIEELLKNPDNSSLHFVIILRWFVVLTSAILQGFSNVSVLPGGLALEASASALSSLFFSWFTNIVWKGWKVPLVQQDIPDLSEKMQVEVNAKLLQHHEHLSRKAGVKFVLWKGLLKCFSVPYCIAMILFYIRIGFVFCTPMLVKLIIQHIQDKDDYTWRGYFYVLLLFICNTIAVILDHNALYYVTMSAVQMSTAVTSAVYRKSLRLGSEARQKFTTGEITNFMSVDAKRILETVPLSYFLFAGPSEILICLGLLYYNIGISILSGVGVLLILVPINLVTNGKAENYLDDQLKAKDQRIKLMNEILAGIKVLKLYAWEKPFIDSINKIRNGEVEILKSIGKLWALVNFTFSSASFLMTLATFFTYTYSSKDNKVSADLIFVCMSLFNLIRLPLCLFPIAIMDFIKLLVSIRRLDGYLNSGELEGAEKEQTPENPNHALEIKDGIFTWEDRETPTLQDLNLTVKQGELVAVVGLVGAGKSSFLSAIMGDMVCLKGEVRRSGRLAYVAQQAWIQNLTLRNNILFGAPLDEQLYAKVIQTCCLTSDLKQLPAGDSTEIGENGINLSGGQKQRVALARAVYQQADVYLIDDPLAALDAHVGAAVFKDVLSNTGVLKGTTRILVTHNLPALRHVDRILVIRNGSLAENGSYQELLHRRGPFSEFLKEHLTELEEEGEEDEETLSEFSSYVAEMPLSRSHSKDTVSRSPLSRSCTEETVSRSPLKRFRMSVSECQDSVRSRRKISTASCHSMEEAERHISSSLLPYLQTSQVDGEGEARLTEDEEALTGNVKMSIYLKYIKALGYCTYLFNLFLYFFCEALLAGASFVLSKWSDDPNKDDPATRDLYMIIYGSLGFSQTIFFILKELILFLACAKASRQIHNVLLDRIMHSPMAFFDTNPIGRILNRFSSDIDAVDQMIPFQLDDVLNCMAEVLGILVIISYSTPWFLLAILPISVLYLLLQKFYISSSRQIRRLDMISTSPIFSHFTETVTGAVSIRAFQAVPRFISESEHLVSVNCQCYWSWLISTRWLGVRLESLGNLIIMSAALLAVFERDTISPGIAGLSISYSLMSTDTLNWMVRMICALETHAICLERIFEYAERPEEAAWDTREDMDLKKNWPDIGALEFRDISASYREGLSPVLKNLSFKISGGEKIGICGRTGAGKSSLSLLIFRIMETNKGKIFVDGVDISTLGLQKLRSKLTIIPQDPVLYSSTLRLNVDPSGLYADQQIRRCLDLAGLTDITQDLDQEVQEKGENFSVGQRQLICLSRALLRNSKLLLLDEATAAVDVETDALVQRTIRSEFKDCTVLTVAHRLNTIMDSHRVMVLDHGLLKEFDAPQTLLQDKNSIFYSLAKESGLV